MKIVHEFHVEAKCPKGGSADLYGVKMEFDVAEGEPFVLVEAIWETVTELTAEPIYQEDLTLQLAKHFSALVSTRGSHLQGKFTTTCVSDETPSVWLGP